MDALDYKALAQLMENGRATWTELAHGLGLSAPAVADRVRRLEERGVIRGYAALVDPEAVGYTLTAFVTVTTDRPEHRAPFLDLAQRLPEVQECHHVAGDDDYLLKLVCRNPRDLDRVVSDELKSLPGVLRTRTTIVLATHKATPVVPLPIAGDGDMHTTKETIYE
jgi:Lrp/AsnC family leucine-responsive transcriptional regulator